MAGGVAVAVGRRVGVTVGVSVGVGVNVADGTGVGIGWVAVGGTGVETTVLMAATGSPVGVGVDAWDVQATSNKNTAKVMMVKRGFVYFIL